MNLRDCLVRYGIVDSHKVCRLPVATQLFFRNLLHAGDGAGRFLVDVDDLRTTFYRHALDGVSRRHISRWLADCHTAGLVRLYTGPDGRGYCELLNYGQRDTKRRIIHPGPQDDTLNFEAALHPPPASGKKAPPHAPPEIEQKGSECETDRAETAPTPRRSAAHTPTLRKTTKLPNLDPDALRAHLDSLGERFPGVNIQAEIERAGAYVRRTRGSAGHLTLKFFEESWLPNAGGPSLADTAPIERIAPEPEYWREMVCEEFPDSPYARGGHREGAQWSELDGDIRRHFLTTLAGWLKRTGRTAA